VRRMSPPTAVGVLGWFLIAACILGWVARRPA
jgi:hypothetical protein